MDSWTVLHAVIYQYDTTELTKMEGADIFPDALPLSYHRRDVSSWASHSWSNVLTTGVLYWPYSLLYVSPNLL